MVLYDVDDILDVVMYDVDYDLDVKMWYIVVYDCVDVVLYSSFYIIYYCNDFSPILFDEDEFNWLSLSHGSEGPDDNALKSDFNEVHKSDCFYLCWQI